MFVSLVDSQDYAKIIYENAQRKFELKSYEEAAELYKEARSINETISDAWYGEALSYLKMGKYNDCRELCDQILNEGLLPSSDLDRFALLAGDSAFAYERSSGVTLVNSDNDDGSLPEGYIRIIAYYDEAINLDPNNSAAWNKKGIALADLGNYTGSIESFNRAIEINSTQAAFYNNKGASLDNQGNHAEAMECYGNATRLDPLLAEAWYNMAKTQWLDLNLFSLARENYNKSVELKPNLRGEQLVWLYIDIDEDS